MGRWWRSAYWAGLRRCGSEIEGVENNLKLIPLPWDGERIFGEDEQGRESTARDSEADLVTQKSARQIEILLGSSFFAACSLGAAALDPLQSALSD